MIAGGKKMSRNFAVSKTSDERFWRRRFLKVCIKFVMFKLSLDIISRVMSAPFEFYFFYFTNFNCTCPKTI